MNNNLTYTRCGDYEIPNLTLSETKGRIGVSCGKRETNVHTSILGVRTGAYAPILKGKIFLP